jgi:hypothetical protein
MGVRAESPSRQPLQAILGGWFLLWGNQITGTQEGVAEFNNTALTP